MITIAKGKSVRISVEPENEEEKPTIDLVDKMRADLHKLNEEEKEDDNS